MRRLLTAILLLAPLWTLSAQAGLEYSVRGVVVDASGGKPLEAVSVMVPGQNYATVTNVETGEAEYIKITDCFGQMEAMRATSAMPFVSRIVAYEGKKYLDGGVADSIPVDKCREMGCDKIIVVLTRPLDYRKSPSDPRLAQRFYGKKYPKLTERINNRYAEYNACVEKIIGMEQRGEIFVIRPSRTVKVKHIERDTRKLQAIYDLGAEDCAARMDELKEYLQ